jgi:hypothetical protein
VSKRWWLVNLKGWRSGSCFLLKHGFTKFSKVSASAQHLRRQTDGMKKVPYWGLENVSRNRKKKFSRPGDLAPGICIPCLKQLRKVTYLYMFSHGSLFSGRKSKLLPQECESDSCHRRQFARWIVLDVVRLFWWKNVQLRQWNTKEVGGGEEFKSLL